MRRIDTRIEGLCLIEPQVFGDHRGWFMESYAKEKFAKLGIEADFVQDNHSFTQSRNTLRGIHFQRQPMAQAKLVRVVAGAVMDVAVDLRRGSPTYLQWEMVELSQENKRMFYIPRGFGHGFLTLTDNVEFVYKVDNPYAKEMDRSIRYDDPEIAIDWGVEEPILSEKDRSAPLLHDSDINFTYERR